MNIRKKLAVIGCPVGHSLSPSMHNAAISYLNLDLDYSAVNVAENELEGFLKHAHEEYCGFNVTVPHKKAIVSLLDKVTEKALFANSVNTVVVNDDNSLYGDSTDGYGLEMALNELFGVVATDQAFLFVGCGGAAQAAAVSLLFNGAKEIYFVNRTIEKAELFIKKLKCRFPKSRFDACSPENIEKFNLFLDKNPVVIQSTSLGLNDKDPCPVNFDFFRKELIYFDMIYNKKTLFLSNAEKKSCRNADGRLMLLYQGAKAFSLWTHKNAPLAIMREALFASMNRI